jgi:hypothetical protein
MLGLTVGVTTKIESTGANAAWNVQLPIPASGGLVSGPRRLFDPRLDD